MTSSSGPDMPAVPELFGLEGAEWDAAFANILITAMAQDEPLDFLRASPGPNQGVTEVPAIEAPAIDKTSSHDQNGSYDGLFDDFINFPPDEEATADPNGTMLPAVDCMPNCKSFSPSSRHADSSCIFLACRTSK